MAAGITIGAAYPARYAGRFCPCQLRRTGLDQKITFVVRAHVLLRHPLNHPVSHINRVKSHVAFLLPSQPSADIQSSAGSFDHDAKLI
jgi:hypothetical protein